jgi:hypothetical protein
MHNLLIRVDFFAYDINFQYDSENSEATSEIGGLFTLLAFWVTFAAMFIDILSFAKVDHFISKFDYRINPMEVSSIPMGDLNLFLFAQNTTSNQLIDFSYVKNLADIDLVLPDT